MKQLSPETISKQTEKILGEFDFEKCVPLMNNLGYRDIKELVTVEGAKESARESLRNFANNNFILSEGWFLVFRTGDELHLAFAPFTAHGMLEG